MQRLAARRRGQAAGLLYTRQLEGMGTREPVLAGRSGLEPDPAPLHPTQKSRPQSRSVESQPPSRRPQSQPLSRCVGRRARRGAAVKGVEGEDRQYVFVLVLRLSRAWVRHSFGCFVDCVGNGKLFIIQWSAQRQSERPCSAGVPSVRFPKGLKERHSQLWEGGERKTKALCICPGI